MKTLIQDEIPAVVQIAIHYAGRHCLRSSHNQANLSRWIIIGDDMARLPPSLPRETAREALSKRPLRGALPPTAAVTIFAAPP
jgi:hypothetical protein